MGASLLALAKSIYYLRAISKHRPAGGLYLGGDLTEGFLRYRFGGLYLDGLYTWRGLFSEFYGILGFLTIINSGMSL